MKVKILIILLLALVAPSLADVVYVNNCTLQSINEPPSSLGSFMNRNEHYVATDNASFDCYQLNLAYWNDLGMFDSTWNTSLNLRGKTWNGLITTYSNEPANKLNNIEIFNGTINGDITIQDNFASNTRFVGIYLHDLVINSDPSSSSLEFENSPSGDGYSSMKLENVVFNIYGDIGVLSFRTNDIKFKNVTFDCHTYCTIQMTETNVEFQDVVFTGTWEEIQSYNNVIILRNVTNFPNIAYGETTTLYNMEKGIFTVKDNKGNDISAVGEAYSLNGDDKGFHEIQKNYNPTKRKIIAFNDGISEDYYVKNVTIWDFEAGRHDHDFSVYNVTVKSNGKFQSKLITFNSPAYAEFVFNEKSILDIILEMISRWLG